MRLVGIKDICVYESGLLIVLIFLGMSMGLWQEILGPTLPNLCVKLNVSYEAMGYAMSMRSVGNIFALIGAAVLYDSYPILVPYFMSLECLVAGIITIIIPWTKSYWFVVVLFFIQSGCQNALNNGGQLTVLRTFKEKSVGKMQLYHLGYGIGGVMSGLISQQFLPKSTTNSKLTKYCVKTLKNVTNAKPFYSNITSSTTKDVRFEYIFLIAGIFAVFSAFLFFSYKFVRNVNYDVKENKKESWLKKINPKYAADGKVCYWSTMTLLLFSYYFFYIFGLLTFVPFIVVYAIDPCKEYSMSQYTATYLHTALNGCFLFGRIIGSFLLEHSPTLTLLIVNALNIVFNFILVFLSHKYALALWIGSCGMRLCNSIVYPSGTSFINRYILVSSSLISLAFLGNTFGSFAGSSLGGYLIDNYPSYYVTYSCSFGMSMLMTIVITIVILGNKYGVRDFSKELRKR